MQNSTLEFQHQETSEHELSRHENSSLWLLNIMLSLQNTISPVPSPLLDVLTPDNQDLDSHLAYAENNAGGGEQEEVDIVSNSFSFPRLTPAHEAKEQPSPVAHAAIPGLSSPEEYINRNNKSLRGKKRSEKKDGFANRRRIKHRVSFCPEIRSNKLQEEKLEQDQEEEEEEEEEEEAIEVEIQPTGDTLATKIRTPSSIVLQQKKQKRGEKDLRPSLVTPTAAGEAMVEQHQGDNDNKTEDSDIITIDESQYKEHETLVAATAELQAAVQQARTVLPFPIPAAGLLAMASMALRNDIPGNIHNNRYLTKCLSIAATLIPAMAAEIARLEQQTIVGTATVAPAPAMMDLSLLPGEILDTPGHRTPWALSIPVHTTTVAAGVAPLKDHHGLISLQDTALNWQPQQQQQQVSHAQPRQTLTIDDPMDELNLILGI
ncbi:hypothetical protein KSW81_003536 [Nannochloris sp. 'desiccata']|nr:hypothetical protein KSW81_003536 [Chlorella desiccata (nom. nud.)]